MKPSEIAASLPFGPHPPKDVHIYVSMALLYLSDVFYEARLESGTVVRDQAEVKHWLAECAAAMNLQASPVNTETMCSAETRAQLRVTGRVPPKSVCGVCFHSHEKESECGVDLGKGGICDCKAEVTA